MVPTEGNQEHGQLLSDFSERMLEAEIRALRYEESREKNLQQSVRERRRRIRELQKEIKKKKNPA